MTLAKANKIALDRYGVGIRLKQTLGKSKCGLKRCQVWLNQHNMNGFRAGAPRRLVAQGDTWEEALKEAGL